MDITAYRLHPGEKRVRISAGEQGRAWMDQTQDSFAYRCLPLNIANQHGWAVSAAKPITALWNGGRRIEDLEVREGGDGVAVSAFGHGILTFHVLHVITLPPGLNLHISGPPNMPKRGITPLTGVYEADWAPFSFTMNWQFTEPGRPVTFAEDEPFCFFFPLPRGLVEDLAFHVADIAAAADLAAEHRTWNDSRKTFLNTLEEQNGGWQKHYFQGRLPRGGSCPIGDHKTKLRLSKPGEAE